jgi:hypothetical protein
MEVTIGLARSDYEKLLHGIPPQHSAYNVLRRSPELARCVL